MAKRRTSSKFDTKFWILLFLIAAIVLGFWTTKKRQIITNKASELRECREGVRRVFSKIRCFGAVQGQYRRIRFECWDGYRGKTKGIQCKPEADLMAEINSACQGRAGCRQTGEANCEVGATDLSFGNVCGASRFRKVGYTCANGTTGSIGTADGQCRSTEQWADLADSECEKYPNCTITPTPTPTQAPTSTPRPTVTPRPTATPRPTEPTCRRGLQDFGVSEPCTAGRYRRATYTCVDGTTGAMGDSTTCKSINSWRADATDVCRDKQVCQ